MNRQVHLGKMTPTAQSPQSKAAAPVGSVLDQVEVLDEALLSMLKTAGRVGRSAAEIRVVRPDDSSAAIERSLNRLRIKKKIALDVDSGRWTVAA